MKVSNSALPLFIEGVPGGGGSSFTIENGELKIENKKKRKPCVAGI